MFEQLATVDPGALDAAGLVEAIVDAERAAAWAMARQAELIAALHRRAVMVPEAADPGRTCLDREALVEAEVATALCVSARTAGTRVDVALALTGGCPAPSPRCAAATWTGTGPGSSSKRPPSSPPMLRTPPPPQAAPPPPLTGQRPASRGIEDAILPRACGQTPTRLRRSLARAVIAADPAVAADRHRIAARERRAWLTALPDAMCELTFRMSAPDGVEVWNRLDQHARTARNGGDPRTLDQLRVDTLVDLLACNDTAQSDPRSTTGSGPSSTSGAGSGSGSGSRRATAHVLVTVAADTLLGLDEEPAELDGYGPVPATLARTIAAWHDATWRRILTDPATGTLLEYGRTTYIPPAALADHVVTRDRTCTFPGCGIAAARCDLDHLIPYPAGPTSPDNLHPLCRRHHLLKHRGRWTVTTDPGTRDLAWTSPAGRRHRSRRDQGSCAAGLEDRHANTRPGVTSLITTRGARTSWRRRPRRRR